MNTKKRSAPIRRLVLTIAKKVRNDRGVKSGIESTPVTIGGLGVGIIYGLIIAVSYSLSGDTRTEDGLIDTLLFGLTSMMGAGIVVGGLGALVGDSRGVGLGFGLAVGLIVGLGLLGIILLLAFASGSVEGLIYALVSWLLFEIGVETAVGLLWTIKQLFSPTLWSSVKNWFLGK